MKWKEWKKEYGDLAREFRRFGDEDSASECEERAGEADKFRKLRPRQLVRKIKIELILMHWRAVANRREQVISQAVILLQAGNKRDALRLLEVADGRENVKDMDAFKKEMLETTLQATRAAVISRLHREHGTIFIRSKGFVPATEFQSLFG